MVALTMQSCKITPPLEALLLIAFLFQLFAALPIEAEYFSDQPALSGHTFPLNDCLANQTDFHGGKCFNTSAYGDIIYKPFRQLVCECTTDKKCRRRNETVRVNVTEMVCDVKPFTECTMRMEEKDCMKSELVKMDFPTKWCETINTTIQHMKCKPECRNETKERCHIHHEIDKITGEKIFPPVKTCTPVVWEKCDLKLHPHNFTMPKVTCRDERPIPFHMFQDKQKWVMTSHMECEVKHSVDCQPVTVEKTGLIEFQECWDEVDENCVTKTVEKPTQPLWEKQFCLE